MGEMSRRSLLAALSATAGAGFLSSCGGVAGNSSAGAPTGGAGASSTVEYAFWGNTVRQDRYGEAFEEMASEFPDINLVVQSSDYNAYRERMTTQMAARDVADVFWVPSPDVLTYHANGIFRRIDDIDSLDLSDFSAEELETWKLNGELNTVPFGIHVPVVRYNRTFAEEDGVELPDEWDWDWLAEFAREYSENNPNGRRALGYRVGHDLSLQNWLRQGGEQLWTEDGRVGFSAENLAGWIDWWEKLRIAGATTSISEQDGVDGSWEDVGDRVLMWHGNANHAIDDVAMFPEYEFGLKHPPIAPDAAEGFRFVYTPRMGVYAGIDDATVEPAGSVLSYSINSVDMLRTVGLTMGTPVNPRVAEEYREFATDIELEMLEVGEADRAAERDPLHEAPPGSGDWRVTLWRLVEDVVNGGTDAMTAASQLISEVDSSIERAS